MKLQLPAKNGGTNRVTTLKARFSGHRFSGKPRFKGHSLEYLGNHFDFQFISLLEIAENLGLADKRVVTDFSAKSSFHCTNKTKTARSH